MNANLRATRLGLVALVRDAARRQRILEEREPRPFRTITMSEYRVLVDCALRARWDQLVRCATQGAIWPGYETPELGCWGGQDRRNDPKSGILDPVFTPAWATRQGQSAYDLRNAILARVPAKYARYSPLSGRWDDRVDVHRAGSVAGPVVTPSHYRLRPSDGISPDSLAFICGEWSPDWMTDPSFSDPAPPARPFG